MLLKFLPVIIEIGLLVYCLIDCIQTDRAAIRNLPKELWVLLIIFLPLIGGIAWLLAGRPVRGSQTGVPWRSTATAGFPEYERPRRRTEFDAIDERLRREQAAVDREHEEALRKWEADLRAREGALDRPTTSDDVPPPDAEGTPRPSA